MSFFAELKRRNVIRIAVAYVVVAWVLLQAIDFTLDIISAPNWVMQVFVLTAAAGLPVALIISWVYEVTPDGIRRESEIDRNQSIAQGTGRKLDRTIIVFLALAVVLLLAERIFLSEESAAPPLGPVTEDKKIAYDAAGNTIRSVAVLPFVNMSSDPEQEYFSDGLSEELLNRLAQNKQLHVAARTSSFQFKGKSQDIGEIGRQLKVENVLEGSVRKSANRLRITAQLIQVDSGYHLWSEVYEREINDIFAIQDEIALAITLALEAELGATSPSSIAHSTENLEAYQEYLQARFLLAKRGEANLLKAHEFFEQTVNLDPGFSKAWSGLAYNYALLPRYGTTISAQQAWEKVKMASDKAIQLDPNNAEAYAALAFSNIQDDFKSILKIFEKAYELAPNSADVNNFYADFMTVIGDFSMAESLQNKAISLDPLAAVHYSDMAYLMFILGRNDEGLEYARTSARLEPESVPRVDSLVVGLMLTGLFDEAIQMINRFEQQPDLDLIYINNWWCMLHYLQGNTLELRDKLDEITEQLETGQGNFYYAGLAFYTIWLDGTDAALPILAEASERNENFLTWPDHFYLPEDISDDPDWLAFWQQGRLAELMDIRRSHKTQEHIGWWKERPNH
jgi:TolB-like protein/Flp pilus assembly protein TadD